MLVGYFLSTGWGRGDGPVVTWVAARLLVWLQKKWLRSRSAVLGESDDLPVHHRTWPVPFRFNPKLRPCCH